MKICCRPIATQTPNRVNVNIHKMQQKISLRLMGFVEVIVVVVAGVKAM